MSDVLAEKIHELADQQARPGKHADHTPPEEPPSSAACVTVLTGLHTAFFTLSDTVLIALTGSALASVIGMFLAILNWLYPREKEKSL